MDYLRSDYGGRVSPYGGRYSAQGGRSSAQGDTTSVLLKRRQYEMKGPQASDIMPVFRMTKA